MSFREWIFSDYTNNPSINGRWGALHISVLILCALVAVGIAFLKKKDEKFKLNIIRALVFTILFFEIARRVIGFILMDYTSANLFGDILHTLLPRPWCAISCWLLISSVFVKKTFFYNLSAMSSIICAVIFFAYPSVGFNHTYILFENLYSITTHALLIVTAISLITLGFTDFKYKRESLWNSGIRELIGVAAIFVYAFIEMFILKIESDPLYFMPDNDVQAFLGVSYPLFIVIYIAFLAFYFNLFYLIQMATDRKRRKGLAVPTGDEEVHSESV